MGNLFLMIPSNVTKQFKQNWYAQDLSDLEYLSDLIEECHEKK